MCVCVHICVHLHIHIHIYIYICIYVCMCVDICLCVYVYVCMCMCVCVHICVHLHRYIQILYVFIYLYIYMCAKYSDFLCIWLRKCDFLTEKLGIGRIRIRNDLFRIRIRILQKVRIRIRIHNTAYTSVVQEFASIGQRREIFCNIHIFLSPSLSLTFVKCCRRQGTVA